MPETVLVTGATGYVAGWTIVALLARGYAVRATVRDAARAEALKAAIAKIEPVDRLTFFTADLTAPTGWAEAMAGCRYVLHVASPLAGVDGEALIAVAVQGTRRVLAAAVAAGVERVVVTSSTAACTPARAVPRAITEADWTDPDEPGLAAYRRSKVLAERAAWDFMKGKSTTLTTLLPGAIFGPVINPDQTGSVSIIRELLRGRPALLPRLGLNITDVRDLAEAHVTAMTEPKAAGERFIVLGEALWFGDVARILRHRLGARAAKVPRHGLPDWLVRLLANFQPRLKELLPLLGRTQKFSADKARAVLGYSPRPPADTIVDCGASVRI